jgi:acyl-CoA synthetase (AMP-forming)/AMP-acid ligase II
LRRVERAASALLRLGVNEGDRVVVAVSAPLEFLSFFLGAQGIGAVPVPAPSLGSEMQFRGYLERLTAVAKDARPAVTLLQDDRAAERVSDELRGLTRVESLERRSACCC